MRQRSKDKKSITGLISPIPFAFHQNIQTPSQRMTIKDTNNDQSSKKQFDFTNRNHKPPFNDTSFKIQIDITPSKQSFPYQYDISDIKIKDVRINKQEQKKTSKKLIDENYNPVRLGCLAESVYKNANEQESTPGLKKYKKTNNEELIHTQGSSGVLTNSTNTQSTNEIKKRSQSFMQNQSSPRIVKPIQTKPPNQRKISYQKCPSSVRAKDDKKDFKLYTKNDHHLQKNFVPRDNKSRQESIHTKKLITSEECNYVEEIQERPKQVCEKYNDINDKMEYFFMCKKKRIDQETCRIIPKEDKQAFYEGIYLIGGRNSENISEILFKYPTNKNSNIEGILPDMLFPKGIEIQKKRLSDSMSELNTIQCQRYIAENNDNCFVMPLKTDQGFQKASKFISL